MAETPQEINWLALLLTSIIGSLAIAIQGYVAYKSLAKSREVQNSLNQDLSSYELALNRKLEEYKHLLDKDLEQQKALFQSEIESRLYHFQTKFSSFHQRRADAIEQLYEAVSEFETDLEVWLFFDELSCPESKEEFFNKIKANKQSLTKLFDRKRIYFSHELAKNFRDFFAFAIDLFPTSFDSVTSDLPGIVAKENQVLLTAKLHKIGDECLVILQGEYMVNSPIDIAAA